MPVRKALSLFWPLSTRDLSALQRCSREACWTTEGCEPDPSEGPGAFPQAWCHATVLGMEGDRVSLPLCRQLGRAQLLAGKGLQQQFVLQGCQAPFRHPREQPDLPLQHQQPTQSMQGDGLAARQGPTPSPTADRQTALHRERAALPAPPLTSAGLLPSCRQPVRAEPSRLSCAPAL